MLHGLRDTFDYVRGQYQSRGGKSLKRIRIIIFIVLVGIVLPPKVTTEAASFPDVVLYDKEIAYLEGRQVIRGFPDGTFKPEQSVTRLQAVQMLLKAKGITDFTAPDPKMADMKPGRYGYQEVAKAVQLGIISGKTASDGTKYFDPAGSLTRGQMAKIIVEANKYPLNTNFLFFDVDPSNSFQTYISTLAAEGVTSGYEDGTFQPGRIVSRQHFSVFVARMLNDSFKPNQQSVNTSFALDARNTYTWSYFEKGKTMIATTKALSQVVEEGEEWTLWQETSDIGTGYFITKETADGLFEGYPGQYVFQELHYPLFSGKSWLGLDGEMYKVLSTDRTISIGTQTYSNVVEVKTSLGYTYFYAPETGLIRTDIDGRTYAQLMNIQTKKE